MKKVYTFLSTFSVALLACASVSFAQTIKTTEETTTHDFAHNPDGVVLNKWAEKTSTDAYNLYLDTYVTGKSFTTNKPLDIVMVLDLSGSMSTSVGTITKYTETKKIAFHIKISKMLALHTIIYIMVNIAR